MKKVISFLLAAVLLLTAFSGCASSQKPQAITTKPISIDGTESVGFTDFDGKLIRYLRQTGLEQENFTVSPLSFKAALVLLLEGADGESKRQLLDALGFSSVEEAEKWYASVLEQEKAFAEWTDDSEESAYRVINSIWHNTSLPGAWIDEYVSAVSEKLRASAYEKPASQITEAVNDWAREQTNGLIPSVIDDASQAAVLLANALYLKCAWLDEFSDVGEKDFTDVSGKTVRKAFISTQENYRYYEDANTQLVAVPLNGGIMMIYVLGDNTDLPSKLKKGSSELVHVQVPKLDLESSFDQKELCNYLASVGCDRIFEEGNGDFRGMFTEDLFVSDIIQKAKVKTDEKGLEAAAVTVIAMVEGCPILEEPPVPKEFVADRPFTFFVMNGSFDAPELLFYGQVMK